MHGQIATAADWFILLRAFLSNVDIVGIMCISVGFDTVETGRHLMLYVCAIYSDGLRMRTSHTSSYRRNILLSHRPNPENRSYRNEGREWLNTDYSQRGLMYKLGVVADPF